MDSTTWGPEVWRVFHAFAASFPRRPTLSDREAAHRYYRETIPDMLPCERCLSKYTTLLRSNPPETTGRTALFEWTVNFHNIVNMLLHKPQFPLEEAVLNNRKLSK